MTPANPSTSTNGSESCNTMNVKKPHPRGQERTGEGGAVRPLDWQDRIVLRGVAVVLMIFVLMVAQGLIQ